MTEENKVNVTLDINGLLNAYKKEDFMKKVFKETLKENPEVFVNSIRDYILADIMKSEDFEKLKKSVLTELVSHMEPEKLKGNHNFISEMNKILNLAIADHKPQVARVVANTINGSDFKKSVSTRIANTVENRVMLSLGEVCEGCERDYE